MDSLLDHRTVHVLNCCALVTRTVVNDKISQFRVARYSK